MKKNLGPLVFVLVGPFLLLMFFAFKELHDNSTDQRRTTEEPTNSPSQQADTGQVSGDKTSVVEGDRESETRNND